MKWYDNLVSKKIMRQLEDIAREESYTLDDRGGIDGRGNDTEDFPEISVVSIQRMLARAYLAGLKNAN